MLVDDITNNNIYLYGTIIRYDVCVDIGYIQIDSRYTVKDLPRVYRFESNQLTKEIAMLNDGQNVSFKIARFDNRRKPMIHAITPTFDAKGRL